MKKLLVMLFALSCSAFARDVTLTWDEASTNVTFNVYRASAVCSPTPVFTLIASNVQQLTYTDVGVADGRYCYRATAVDIPSQVESGPSNPADAKVAPVPPMLHTPPVITGN